MSQLQDRIAGALAGMVLGDAFGVPGELWPRAKVRERFGRITEFLDGPADNIVACYFKAGHYTDDSAQAFVVLNAIEAAGTVPPDAFRHRRIVRPCFNCSDIQHRTVGPLKNPGLRTCAFAAPRAAEIESQIRLIHDAALYGSGGPFGKGVPGCVIFFMRENVASVVHHESSASTFPMRNIHFSDVFNI